MSDREITFRIAFDESHNYKHVNAWVECMPEPDSSGRRNLEYGSNAYASDTEFFKVKVTSQTDLDSLRMDKGNPVYAERVLWDDDFTIENAEHAVKALRKIRKYLDSAHEVAGGCNSFGQYLLRVMKACKAKRATIKIDRECRSVSVDYAAKIVDDRIQEWRNKARETYGVKTEW